MDIQIKENPNEMLQVIILCKRMDGRVNRLKAHIALFDNRLQAKQGEETRFVSTGDVLYFESVDNRTFLYTADAVMEIGHRLYELELMLSERDFIRISKSQILNVQKIAALTPELNRTLTATLCNGERVGISRKYVPMVRKLLSI